MQYVVGTLYGSRAVWVLGFLLLPKNTLTIIGFLVLLGLTGAATVTPTSGLTGRLFGSENLATLFGIVFVSHQEGSFLSAWLGGRCFEVVGSYTPIWVVSAVLSVAVMAASYMISNDKV